MPWFACTATLDKETYVKVMKLAGFSYSTTELIRTLIDQPDLAIIRGYIKRRDKNNYKALFFVIKDAFKEDEEEEDAPAASSQTPAAPSAISTSSSQISAAPSAMFASSSQTLATSVHQPSRQTQVLARGATQSKKPKVPSPEKIPKTIIFLYAKNHIRACTSTICSWLVAKGYTKEQAKKAVQSYHATVANWD